MPRDLWHLEGQQLRLLRERARTAARYVSRRPLAAHPRAIALDELRQLTETIDEILKDGPHSRDETC